MKKLITLAVAVLAGALLFTGCYSEIAPEYNKESIAQAEREKANAAAKAAEKAQIESRIWYQSGITFPSADNAKIVECPVKTALGNTQKALKLVSNGSWDCNADIVFTSRNQDFTGKTVKITYIAEGYTSDSNGMKLILDQDATHKTEMRSWGFATTASPASKSISVTDATNVGKCWSADDSILAAELDKIGKITFQAQKDKGTIYIINIELQ